MKIMMSSCMTGLEVMYWGGNFFNQEFTDFISAQPDVEVVHFCPEHIMLGTPRNNMLIHDGDGEDLWEGKARLLDTEGNDLTETMKQGAQRMLEFAQKERPDLIILVEGSDSCGVNFILDPDNKNSEGKYELKAGMGVAAALLKKHGFKLLSHKQEKEIREFFKNR